MLVLFETPAGFALFKVLDERKLSKVDDLWKEFSSVDTARQRCQPQPCWLKASPTKVCVSSCVLIDGESFVVADSKLGNVIKEKLQIDCVHNQAVMELMRGVRSQLTELITGSGAQDLAPVSLGVSQCLSGYKLKFRADKIILWGGEPAQARLRNLEGRELGRSAGSTKGKPKIEAYNKDFKKGDGAMITPA
ncbi:hypothetical protein Hanom_Chr13g01224271 [Helianthus anomalus]